MMYGFKNCHSSFLLDKLNDLILLGIKVASLTFPSDLYTMRAMKQEEFLEKLDINVTKTDINIAKGQPIA